MPFWHNVSERWVVAYCAAHRYEEPNMGDMKIAERQMLLLRKHGIELALCQLSQHL